MRAYVKVFVSIFILTLTTAAGYYFFSGNIFRLQDVQIELQDNVKAHYQFKKIKETLDVRLAHLAGRNIWTIDIEGILSAVRGDMRVKDASVYRQLPNTIQIKITPYTALANILGNESDKIYPVARDGEVMPYVPTIEASDSPILRGEKFLKNEKMRKEALNMLLALPSTGPLSLKHVSEVEFKNKSGYLLTLSPIGTEVWLGFDDFTRRSSHAAKVLSYLSEKEMRGRVIDARYGKKVVVKLRNDP